MIASATPGNVSLTRGNEVLAEELSLKLDNTSLESDFNRGYKQFDTYPISAGDIIEGILYTC